MASFLTHLLAQLPFQHPSDPHARSSRKVPEFPLVFHRSGICDGQIPARQPPLVLLRGISPLHVRVDVDENDAWRVPVGASATGCLRGHNQIKTPLKFVRFEPYVVPKKSLSGDSTERSDTRMLQVISSFERGDLPIYVGQQMDGFINGAQTTVTP